MSGLSCLHQGQPMSDNISPAWLSSSLKRTEKWADNLSSGAILPETSADSRPYAVFENGNKCRNAQFISYTQRTTSPQGTIVNPVCISDGHQTTINLHWKRAKLELMTTWAFSTQLWCLLSVNHASNCHGTEINLVTVSPASSILI